MNFVTHFEYFTSRELFSQLSNYLLVMKNITSGLLLLFKNSVNPTLYSVSFVCDLHKLL